MALKIGVYGVYRGASLANCVIKAGAEVVALCDQRINGIKAAKESNPALQDAAEYAEFEEFIKHDMDAVLLVNY